MRVFWQRGYTEASLELLAEATGLGRGSLYGTFGSKDALFRASLDRYAAIYGARYDSALRSRPDDPAAAVEAFFDVILDRIADPAVPDGCLMVQSAAQAPVLDADSRDRVRALLDTQRRRVRAALAASGLDDRELDDLAGYVVAVNHSLAVLSRAGTPMADLRAVARIAGTTVADALSRRRARCGR
ncbi:TetR/AcrR family transcriptional regulator [Pseudonocardia acaciae]|uniref:TetR/AcrR family transcriptional regulator n=1 Tax=Pseudonocardia acaciae TaxID=551276 RepID=UPI000688CB95|nr:TetR/AcrR family transcriptional regulator [Pseudonocardia acaciae]